MKGRWYICERYRRQVRYVERPGVVHLRASDCPTRFATEAEAEATRRTWEEQAIRRPVGAFVQYERPLSNPQPQPQHDHREGNL